ncbi:hypothetical protein BDZ89DRAFT_1071259 [Hymenopellis radicata]|nr:hypothetical protein BDZ89DRAFT_1071259 [Hymenopellis radicata]
MSMQIFGDQVRSIQCNGTRLTMDIGHRGKGGKCTLSSFVGALALGDLVKSTLGPKGMNKILQSASTGDINV